MSLYTVTEILRRRYLPPVMWAIKEHEETCKKNPALAEFLASLPNGTWRHEDQERWGLK